MTHQFFSKALRHTLVTPNKIVVQSRPDDEDQYSGEATDATSYALMPKVEYFQTYLTSNDQAQAIAEAKLAQAQMWCEAGAVTVPMTLGQEPFDYVNVVDVREGDQRAGNVGQLTRYYSQGRTKHQSDKWGTKIVFGNWQSVRKALANLNITSDELQNYFSRLVVKDLYAEHIQADSLDMVWIDPDGNIDLSQIGDNLDNLPDGEVYARVKTLHLDAGIIKLDENIIYSSGYNPTDKFDLNNNDLDDIPEGTVYQRVKSASLSAEGLVLLDQVQIGDTYGLLYKTYINAGQLYLATGTIEDSTHRLVTDTEKGSWGAKTITFAQDSVPTSLAVGDLWIDTNDANKLYRAYSVGADEITAGEWQLVRDTDIAQALSDAAGAQATADGKVVTFLQDSEPTAEGVGDLWMDTNDGNKVYRWSGAAWVEIQDDGIAQAISDAAGAQATADSKIVTFYQDAVPTSLDIGDLWVDTDDNNKMYRAACVGADQITAGEWELCVDVTAAGGANVFRQDSAPTSGMVQGDIWIDTNAGDKPYTYSGAAWIPMYTDISGGDIVTGTITASKLTFDPYILGTHDADDIDDGSTYGVVRISCTDGSGYIQLNQYTKVNGEWYDESGVEIDSAHGINIYGTNNALTTRATKTGTIQCYVGADGKIYAGGGNVYLDSTGLHIKGQYAAFYYGSNIYGYCHAAVNGFCVEAAYNHSLQLIATGAGNIYLTAETYWNERLRCNNNSASAEVIKPYAHHYGDVGQQTDCFRYMYADDFREYSPKVEQKASYLKEMEKFKVNKDTGHWDYSTLPQHRIDGDTESADCFSLGAISSFLLCAMGEVKDRLEKLESKIA